MKCGTGGFTLLEISMVLIIIGLLAGSILMGRDLIEIATIRKTYGQVEEFKTATMAFFGKYDCYPGDCHADKADELGLEPRSGDPGHGNGDGVMTGCSTSVSNGAIIDNSHDHPGCETLLYWRDLLEAGLIGSVSAVATDNGVLDMTAEEVPQYFPGSAMGKSTYFALYHSNADDENGRNRFALGKIQGTSGTGIYNVRNALTYFQVLQFDRKFDDGIAMQGTVRVLDFPWDTLAPPRAGPTRCMNGTIGDYDTYAYNTDTTLLNTTLCAVSFSIP